MIRFVRGGGRRGRLANLPLQGLEIEGGGGGGLKIYPFSASGKIGRLTSSVVQGRVASASVLVMGVGRGRGERRGHGDYHLLCFIGQ